MVGTPVMVGTPATVGYQQLYCTKLYSTVLLIVDSHCFAGNTILSRVFRNATDYPLTIQLCQLGVLYHDYVKPGETFYRNTGAVHFTIVAQINFTGRDTTNLGAEAIAPVGLFALGAACMGAGAGVAAFGHACPALAPVLGAKVAGLPAIGAGLCGTIGGLKAIEFYFLKMSSSGWYAGHNHELEIRGGGDKNFYIYNKKDQRRHYL